MATVTVAARLPLVKATLCDDPIRGKWQPNQLLVLPWRKKDGRIAGSGKIGEMGSRCGFW
jgi:hypothetical protein